MHLIPVTQNSHTFEITRKYSFILSCLAICESEDFFTTLLKSHEKFDSDRGYCIFNEWHGIYRLTTHIHEKRHFHDFIESPVALPILIGASHKWYTTGHILSELRRKKVGISTPIYKNIENIYPLVEPELVSDIIKSDMFDNYLFRYRAKSQNIPEWYKKKFDEIILDPFPSLPAFITKGLVIPIALREIMEGSAVLSQLSWVCTSFGSENAEKLWQTIDGDARSTSQYQYVVCLWALQDIFGYEKIFIIESIRVFRRIFRFAMSGSFMSPYDPFEILYEEDKMNDLPYNRFATILKYIKKNHLEKNVLNEPDVYLNQLIDYLYPKWPKKIKKHKSKVKKIIRVYKKRPDKSKSIITDIICQALRFHLYAIKKDIGIVDKYLDILWADDEIPNLIEAPIQISGIGLGDEYGIILKMTEEFGSIHLWLSMLVIDNLTNQLLSSNGLLCPLINIKPYCDGMMDRKKSIILEKCDRDCVVKKIARIMRYID